jgi:DNA-binding response OmpR family regulator
MKKILLIEDDANLAFMLVDGLESEGFNVFHITNAEEVVETMDDFMLHVPDLILLDVNLKGAIDGFELSKKIRQKSQIPIIFTTARTQIEDLQQGFSIGNVDYLKKPFGIRELVLHINEMISRWQHTLIPQSKLEIGNYVFVPTELNLYIGNEKIKLQKNECAVLALLAENRNNVVNKNEILESVWNDGELKQKEASLNNILSSIRNKLSLDKNIGVDTIPKVGWKLRTM